MEEANSDTTISSAISLVALKGISMALRTFTVPAGGFLAGDTFTTSNPNVQMVKVGANYLFKYGVGGY